MSRETQNEQLFLSQTQKPRVHRRIQGVSWIRAAGEDDIRGKGRRVEAPMHDEIRGMQVV